MRTKYFLLGTATLLTAAALWFGRAVWRVHHQLVTLNVRNAPLPAVLGMLQRQTWTKLRAEKDLDGVRITLRVTDAPLNSVLDRIAEQAGARCTTIYALYDSSRELKGLDTALRGDGKLEPAHWQKLAPTMPSLPQGSPELRSFASGPGPGASGPEGVQLRAGPGMAPGAAPEPGASGGPGGQHRFMMARRGPNGPVVFFGGPAGRTEVWYPHELVAPSALSARLGSSPDLEANAAVAAATARKLHAGWTTYLAFSKSSMGVGFVAPHGPPRPGQAFRGPDPDERFRNLTPEQRVERARQRLGLKSNPQPQ